MRIKDKEFVLYLREENLKDKCAELAERISSEFKDKNPLFISVLNGSFVFTSDLIRYFDFPLEISFIKVSSYVQTKSSGNVKEVIGMPPHMDGRHIIILEDIVDTGSTLKFLLNKLTQYKPFSVSIAAMFLKPDIFDNKFPVEYVGFEIPDRFVVGYGLDYDGMGRNLKDLYQLKTNHIADV